MRDVVVTGLGVVSPIGIGNDAFQAALAQGKSGVKNLPWLACTEMPIRFGSHLADFDGRKYVAQRKTLKLMSREVQTGYAAAEMALAEARWSGGCLAPERVGVVFASELLYSALEDFEGVYRRCTSEGVFRAEMFGEHILADVFPLWMLKYLPNGAACHVGIAHDARGPNNSIVSGDASSLLAMMEAARVIERNQADLMIVGGAGTRVNISASIYRGTLLQSQCRSCPEAASRPFDAQRDGMVNGEGAGALILETTASAKSRGATPLARVLGAASSFGARGTPAFSQAVANSIRQALREAGLAPGDIGHVNAHGLSTVTEDQGEAAAIRQTLGETPVTALKSYFGNLGAGGGLVELVASVLSFTSDEVSPTLNYQHPDPNCPIQVIHGGPLRGAKRTAIVLSQSLSGQAAAVVIAAP